MKKNIKYFILIIVVFGFINLNAQKDTITYHGKAKAYQNAIVLRWNTSNASEYLKVIPNGFIIKKYIVEGSEKQFQKQFQIEIKNPKQYSKNDIDTNNKNALTAFGVLDKLTNWKFTTNNADLGSQLKNNQRLNTMWGFGAISADMDTTAANILGIRFYDPHVNNANTYLYQIYCPFKNPQYISDTLWIRIEKGYDTNANFNISIKSEKGEKAVQLKWQTDKKYSAYFIERADASSNNYKLLNKTAIATQINKDGINMENNFTDSLAQNYIKYKYRLVAIDMFADKYYSKEIIAWGVDKTAPLPVDNFKADLVNNKTIKLTWNLPKNMSPDTKGYLIQKQATDLDSFKLITPTLLPLSTKSFIDNFEDDVYGYTYYLYTIDTANNASLNQVYIMKPDSVPPAQPQGLKAKVNKKGVVTLTWNLGKEEDLDGYLVYFSNHLKHNFSSIQGKPLIDTFFRDTLELNMLNKKLYYKIVAADKNFNRSIESEIVEVLRPDTIAPVSPVITNYLVSDTTIMIQWVKSSSQDVKFQKLIRTDKISKKQDVKMLKLNDTIFVDKNLKPGLEIEYSIIATDADSNSSKPINPILLSLPDKGIIKGVENMNLKHDTTKKVVVINWSCNENVNTKYLIYKGLDENSLSILATVSGNKKSFSDTLIKKGNTYFYSIVVIEGNGKRSVKSKVLKIDIN